MYILAFLDWTNVIFVVADVSWTRTNMRLMEVDCYLQYLLTRWPCEIRFGNWIPHDFQSCSAFFWDLLFLFVHAWVCAIRSFSVSGFEFHQINLRSDQLHNIYSHLVRICVHLVVWMHWLLDSVFSQTFLGLGWDYAEQLLRALLLTANRELRICM